MNWSPRAPGAPSEATKMLRKIIIGLPAAQPNCSKFAIQNITGLFSFLFPEQLMTLSDCDLQDQVIQELSSR